MLKIKDKLVGRIFRRTDLSSMELNVLLALIARADIQGKVDGVYYKEIAELVGCCHATFYNVLTTLEKKDFIECKKDSVAGGEWTITVLGNDFSLDGDTFSQYANFNIGLLEDKRFYALKATEKRMMIYFVFRVLKQKTQKVKNENKLLYSPTNDYKNMEKTLAISPRMRKIYMQNLINVGLIQLGENIDVNGTMRNIVTVPPCLLKPLEEEITEKGTLKKISIDALFKHYKHMIRVVCRRLHILYDGQNVADSAELFVQYRQKAQKNKKDIYKLIWNAIYAVEERILNSVAVHSVLSNIIDKDYTNNLVYI